MKLPLELKQEICLYLNFDKLSYIFPDICKYIFNLNILPYENSHFMKYMLCNNLIVLTLEDIMCIIDSGNLKLLKWINKKCLWPIDKIPCIGDNFVIRYASYENKLDILNWLYVTRRKSFYITKGTTANACSNFSKPETIKWLLDHQTSEQCLCCCIIYTKCPSFFGCNSNCNHIKVLKIISDYITENNNGIIHTNTCYLRER